MADEFATLNLRIRNNEFNKGVNESMGKISGLGDIAQEAGKSLASLFIIKKGAGIAKQLMDLASDAEEVNSKFKVIFRDISAEAENMANNFARDFDLAGSSARRLLGNSADLLTGFGFTQAKALELSDQVNRLAGDLASFSNIEGGASRASEILTKAMLGEIEGAKMLGIAIQTDSEAYKKNLKQKMEVEGLTKAQAKALIALEEAYRQSGNAIGDVNRTRNSEANLSRAVAQSYLELKETIGATISETLNWGGILSDVNGALKAVTKWISGLDDGTKKALMRITLFGAGILIARASINAIRTALMLKKAMMAQATQATMADTTATGLNTQANIANANSMKMQASAGGGAMGGFNNNLGKTTSLLGQVGKGLGFIGQAGMAFGAGWQVGRIINEFTGLDGVLEDFYGNLFYNMDELEKRAKDLDAQIAKNQRKGRKTDYSGDEIYATGNKGYTQAEKDKIVKEMRSGIRDKYGKVRDPEAYAEAMKPKKTQEQIAEEKQIARVKKETEDYIFENKLKEKSLEDQIQALKEKGLAQYNKDINNSEMTRGEGWLKYLKNEERVNDLIKEKEDIEKRISSIHEKSAFKKLSNEEKMKVLNDKILENQKAYDKATSSKDRLRLAQEQVELQDQLEGLKGQGKNQTIDSQLTSAVEMGTLEALRLENRRVIGGKDPQKETAKNTKIMADELKRFNDGEKGGQEIQLVQAV
jgi:hypothetical protein